MTSRTPATSGVGAHTVRMDRGQAAAPLADSAAHGKPVGPRAAQLQDLGQPKRARQSDLDPRGPAALDEPANGLDPLLKPQQSAEEAVT